MHSLFRSGRESDPNCSRQRGTSFDWIQSYRASPALGCSERTRAGRSPKHTASSAISTHSTWRRLSGLGDPRPRHHRRRLGWPPKTPILKEMCPPGGLRSAPKRQYCVATAIICGTRPRWSHRNFLRDRIDNGQTRLHDIRRSFA
jgi:hypothetical protein